MFKTRGHRNCIGHSILATGTILFCLLWLSSGMTPARAKEVDASKMPGFNPSNATKALQSALDSGADKVIVPNVGQPWIVTPIQFRSDQTVVFQPGVVILAKKGEFHGRSDCLFTAQDVKNLTIIGKGATFRMHKEDYARKPYTKAQWRHALSLLGCTNVTIEGLTLEKSGGDGLYISRGKHKMYSENITIRNVNCVDNYRQGISVISADHLLMENVVLRDTGGTAPQAGIDFEPNRPDERLSHITVRNCLSQGNRGRGYHFYVKHLHADSTPISITIENSQAIGNRSNPVGVTSANDPAEAPSGFVIFKNCTFKGGHGAGINIGGKPADAFKVKFQKCLIADISEDKANHPIELSGGTFSATPIGGITFEDCQIVDSIKRSPIGYTSRSVKAALKDISGTLIVSNPSGTHQVQLSAEELNRRFGADFPSVPFVPLADAQWMTSKATSPDNPIKLNKANARGESHFALNATKDDKVEVTIRYAQGPYKRGKTMSVEVIGPNGKTLYEKKLPFKKNSKIQFTAPADGLYRITADPHGNAVRIVSSTNPVGLVTSKASGLHLFESSGMYYFWVPKGTKKFAVQGVGSGKQGFRMALKDPDGKTVKSIDNILSLHQITVDPRPDQTGKIWCLEAKKSSKLYFHNYFVRLLGVPPLLTTNKGAVIKSKPAGS